MAQSDSRRTSTRWSACYFRKGYRTARSDCSGIASNGIWSGAGPRRPSTIDPDGRRTVLVSARRMLNEKLIPYGSMVMVMEESLVSKELRDLT
ncbi:MULTISPECIES: hypothetical protein [unclassified Paenibacillus]|uniref:hypothetical protein n=1 Tax=unclassified Paenibacillus TaxID=185978 RepID=UPI00362EEEE5